MIFWYSGTGNSLDAAKRLRIGEEALLSAADCLREGRLSFSPQADEAVGFVLPVYFGNLPQTVRDFLSRVRFETRPAYVYGVLTCGGNAYEADRVLAQALAAAGCAADAVWTVRMPENNVVCAVLQDAETVAAVLARAQEELAAIRGEIEERVRRPIEAPPSEDAARRREKYDLQRRTAPFHVADTCVHCGVCASRCPCGALVMSGGAPTWVRERCDFCMACIRCGAILYDGDRITGKPRYVHPALKQQKH